MRTQLSLGVLLAIFSFPAFAFDWYVGVGGATELGNRTPKVLTLEGKAESAKLLLGGIEFNSHFGVELSWVDLGSVTFPGLSDAGYSVDGNLWTISGTWSPDTGKIRPFARIGWFSRQEDGVTTTIVGEQPISFDDNGLAAELGGRWHIGDHLALRVGYAWYRFDSKSDGSLQAAAELRF